MLNNCILKNSAKISRLINKLPSFVKTAYFKKIIISEAKSNNEIEGIKVTKEELKSVLDELEKSEIKNKMFLGMMRTYRYIDQIEPLRDIKEFRILYNNVVSDKIKSVDIPDGKLFRNGYVEVNDGSKRTHIGIESEEKIVEALTKLIHYLQEDTHPLLYRILVAHYYYEYIHPFYDGNGRTGRILVGIYLARYLEKFTGVTFSYTVNRNKSIYYESLEEISSPLNQGDMTCYLLNMLSLLAEGQQALMEDLEISLLRLERFKENLKTEEWLECEDDYHLIYYMVVMHLFVGDRYALTIQELMDLSSKSRYLINKSLEYLEKKGLIELVSEKPKAYKLSEKYLNTHVPI